MSETQFDYSQDLTTRGAFLVYICGVEVPAMSVNVSCGVWNPPSIQIQLPPSRKLQRLGEADRVKVAVFYLDTHYSSDGVTPEKPEFRLLAEGEIVAVDYQQGPSDAYLTIHANAEIGVLTQLFPFFASSVHSSVAARTEQTTAPTMVTVTDNPLISSLWFRGVSGSQPIKRPYDFVENILRLLLDGDRSTVAQAFFSKWARKNNFHNKWVPCPYLETSDLLMKVQTDDGEEDFVAGVFPVLKAVQSDEVLRALRVQANRVGSEGSFWDLIQGVFTTVYYEVAHILAPPAATIHLHTGEVLGEPRWVGSGESPYEVPNFRVNDSEDTKFIREDAPEKGPLDSTQPIRIFQNLTKPQLAFTAPPMCNVIYPSQVSNKVLVNRFATKPTRIYLSDPSWLHRISKEQRSPIHQIMMLQGATVAHPKQLQDLIDKQPASDNPFDHLVWPEEYFKGPVTKKDIFPSWFSLLHSAYSAPTNNEDARTFRRITEQQTYRLYAAMELIRERGAHCYGSVSSMAFDPYIVPGFPGFIADPQNLNIHYFMYVTSVTHTLSDSAFNTSLEYTFAQTLPEFFEALWENRYGRDKVEYDLDSSYLEDILKLGEHQDLLETLSKQIDEKRQELERLRGEALDPALREFKPLSLDEDFDEAFDLPDPGEPSEESNAIAEKAASLVELQEELQTRLNEDTALTEAAKKSAAYLAGFKDVITDYAPASPFPDIRKRFQTVKHAKEFYDALFHQNNAQKEVVFNWKKALEVERRPDDDIDSPTDIVLTENKDDCNSIEHNGQTPTILLSGPYKRYAESRDAAMRAKSRPVCTLEDYINFYEDRGVRVGKIEASDKDLGKGATYYEQILSFNFDQSEFEEETMRDKSWAYVETLKNWVEVLKDYRKDIYSGLVQK